MGGEVRPRVLALVVFFASVAEGAAQDAAVDAGIQLSPQCEAIRNQYQQSLDHALQQRASTIKNGYPTQDVDATIAFYRKAIVEGAAKCERVRAENLAFQAEQKADEERTIREAEAQIKRAGDEEDRATAQSAKARARCTPPPNTSLRQVDAAMTCLGKAITVLGRNEVKTSEGFLVMMKSDNGTGLFYILDPKRSICSAVISAPEDSKLVVGLQAFGVMARCGFGVDDKTTVRSIPSGAGTAKIGQMYIAHSRIGQRHNIAMAYSASEAQEIQKQR